jgi:peptide/nickel transport system substrate-binding protein
VDKTLAAAAVKAGELDYYIFGLNPSQVEVIAGDPEYILYRAPSGMNNIGLNPAPSIPGTFNPFSIREVRFAMNYIVDRDFIVNQLYQGSAAPMFTFMSSYDPDFVTIYEIVAKYEFGYDLTTAASIVDPAMTAAGCEKVEGKWHYQGTPVTIKFIIRVEDERREIGDTFALTWRDLDLLSIGSTCNLDRLFQSSMVQIQENSNGIVTLRDGVKAH